MNWLAVLTAVHWCAGLVVLAEALNKLERIDIFGTRCGPVRLRLLSAACLFMPCRWTLDVRVRMVRSLAWALAAVGAAGSLVGPFIGDAPSPEHAALLVSVACFVIANRFAETRGEQHDPIVNDAGH